MEIAGALVSVLHCRLNYWRLQEAKVNAPVFGLAVGSNCVSLLLTGVAIEGARRGNPFIPDRRPDSSDEEMAQAWAKHYPQHRADKVSEHVCRLICLCVDYRVIGEISGGDTATGLERVLASVRIQKKEFDDVTNTYESWIVPQRSARPSKF